jgi:site-specific recombinase XerD
VSRLASQKPAPIPRQMISDSFAVLADWSRHLGARGLSPETVDTYRSYVARAGARVGKDPLLWTEADVDGYLEDWYPPRGPSRGECIQSFKSFFRWAERRELCSNPTSDLPSTKRRKRGPVRYHEPAEVRAFLRAAFRTEPRRGWALLLALSTGGRARALTKVRPEHVNLKAAELYFAEAKGDRDYAVPLGREGMIAVRHLLADAKAKRRQTLIGVGYGRFWEWVREAKQAAHIESSPHWLRRTFGSYTARRTDPEVWRQLMGHSDLSQWPRYVGTDRQAVKNGVARVLRSA